MLANNLPKLSNVNDHKSEFNKSQKRDPGASKTEEDWRPLSSVSDTRSNKTPEWEQSDIKLERQDSNPSQWRESFRRILYEDTILAQCIRTLFRKQGDRSFVNPYDNWNGNFDPNARADRRWWNSSSRHRRPNYLKRAAWKRAWKNYSRPLNGPWLKEGL